MLDLKSLKFDPNGLLPVIAQDHISQNVLMLAWMNTQALHITLQTKKMTYWSRSRQKLWVKGETSGHTQEMIEMRLDCDRDCLLALVKQTGPACHTNRPSCFYTAITEQEERILTQPISV